VELALLASSVAIEKADTAVVSPEELLEAEIAAHREPFEAKIATSGRMVREVERWRGRGLKIGFTNGCFDLLQSRPYRLSRPRPRWCDRLIVSGQTAIARRGL